MSGLKFISNSSEIKNFPYVPEQTIIDFGEYETYHVPTLLKNLIITNVESIEM